MKVHEYQAKEILAHYGVAIPRGRLVTRPEEARAAASDLGGRVVVKAQVHAGGRGKAGGVWYLIIRNDLDTEDILRKALKDKNGGNVSDIKVGALAQELASDV